MRVAGKRACALAALLVCSAVQAAAPETVRDESFRDAEGQRVLKESLVVAAPVHEVWKAFTTDAGFTRWAVKVAHITPGNGGLIEFALGDDGKIGAPDNVRNRIDVYLPERLLVMHNEFVPAGGPLDPATFATVRTLIELVPVRAGRTRVTQTVVGFGPGPKYEELYSHLHDGNASYLAALAKCFEAN